MNDKHYGLKSVRKDMRKISLEEIQDGMVLAQEMQDDKGRVLLKKGDLLRSAYKSKLSQWGIEEIFIVAGSGDLDGETPNINPEDVKVATAIIAKYERLLEQKFCDFPDNVLMNTIKSVAISNLAHKEAMKNAGF